MVKSILLKLTLLMSVIGLIVLTTTSNTSSTTSVSPSQNQEPVEVVSVLGPIPPYYPAGPTVDITLKNISEEPVIYLKATLEVGRSFDFDFNNISLSNPLLTGESSSKKLTLIQGGFGSETLYPLTINVTLQSGATFTYAKQVYVIPPPTD